MREIFAGLWQGDIGDLNALKLANEKHFLKFTLAINVGSTPFVPRDVQTVYFPMRDESDAKLNDWERAVDYVKLAVREIRRGGKVLVTCDAGISRSVVFAGMVTALYKELPMDDKLMQALRHPCDPPLEGLWKSGQKALLEYG